MPSYDALKGPYSSKPVIIWRFALNKVMPEDGYATLCRRAVPGTSTPQMFLVNNIASDLLILHAMVFFMLTGIMHKIKY